MLCVALVVVMAVSSGQGSPAPQQQERIFGMLDSIFNPTTTTTTSAPTTNIIDAIGGVIGGLFGGDTTTTTVDTTQNNIIDGVAGLIFGTTTQPPTTEENLISTLLGLLGVDSATTETPTSGNFLEGIAGIFGENTSSNTPASPDLIQSMINVLNGGSNSLPVNDLMSLMGLQANNPVPSPFKDAVGFMLHPLVSPVILAAVTANLPALVLAKAQLAGNVVLQMIMGAPTF